MGARKLSETDAAIAWLRQFAAEDQPLATALLDAMTLVSYQEFSERLRALILERAKRYDGPVGLYAEREIRKWKGAPIRLFKETKGKVRRAYGAGPKPVSPTRTIEPEVGSEGLVAQILTEICRSDRKKFLSHPGPDEIRNKQIRAFFLVSDFIGSGARARTYLEAAWRVASVKSWCSWGLMKPEVIAYSATAPGRVAVESHASRPSVSVVVPCPTIEARFRGRKAVELQSLCIRYNRPKKERALGFGDIGALLAFAHGCPNNAPRILHASHKRWKPLFLARVTAAASEMFGDRRDVEVFADRLRRLGERRIAGKLEILGTTKEGRAMIALLAALRRGPRREIIIAERTGLTIPEVAALIARAKKHRWIGEDLRLTDQGHKQLAALRKHKGAKESLPSEPDQPYYPTSLRAPLHI